MSTDHPQRVKNCLFRHDTTSNIPRGTQNNTFSAPTSMVGSGASVSAIVSSDDLGDTQEVK